MDKDDIERVGMQKHRLEMSGEAAERAGEYVHWWSVTSNNHNRIGTVWNIRHCCSEYNLKYHSSTQSNAN